MVDLYGNLQKRGLALRIKSSVRAIRGFAACIVLIYLCKGMNTCVHNRSRPLRFRRAVRNRTAAIEREGMRHS